MCVYQLIRSGGRSAYYCNFKALMSVNGISTLLQPLLGAMEIPVEIPVVSFGGQVTGTATGMVA